MLIATEKKTVFLKDYLSGIQLKKMLNILTDIMADWPDEGSLKVNFIAIHEKTAIFFNGDYAEALELLEKYPDFIIRPESLSGVKVAWKNTRVVLKDARNALKKGLEIEIESEDVIKTKKMAAAAFKCLEND